MNIRRRNKTCILKMALGVVLVFPVAPFCEAQVKTEVKPNILYIMADDFAVEAISAYGSWLKDYAKTPNIDRIAAEGMRFNNVCCNNSICAPSRASILTGQYSHMNNVPILSPAVLNPESPLYPKEIIKGGYQTAIVGKWHLDTPATFFEYSAVVEGHGTYFDPVFIVNGKPTAKIEGYSSDVYTDKALKWLDQRNKDKPFLLCLHFKAPHLPAEYPDRVSHLLEGVTVPEPSTLFEDIENSDSQIKKRHQMFLNSGKSYYNIQARHKNNNLPPHDPNDPKSRTSAAYQDFIHKYIRAATTVDENVGRVLKYLDKNKLNSNTIVIFTSDQGYWLGQHGGMYDKRLILDPSLKMPFLVRYPAEIQPGTISNEMCSNVDFAETFLDYAGVPAPSTMQGRSMRPVFQGNVPEDWPDAVFYNYAGGSPCHYGLRTKQYTIAHVYGKTWELYDCQNDPEQIHNLASNPEYAQTLQELQNKLSERANLLGATENYLTGLKNWPIYEKLTKTKKDGEQE